jgi:hypothetical protein
MDDADQIEVGAAVRDLRARREQNRVYAEAMIALARVPRADRADIACIVIDLCGAGPPDPVRALYERFREEAAFWADCASLPELEAYGAAALREIEDRGGRIPAGMLKRLLVDIWARLSEQDRRQFLARVDPRGLFQGKGAA